MPFTKEYRRNKWIALPHKFIILKIQTKIFVSFWEIAMFVMCYLAFVQKSYVCNYVANM